MVGWLWLLAVYGVWGASHPLADWKTFLTSIDNTLPWTTAQGSLICYYFDTTTTCSGQNIADLLSQATPITVASWTPTAANCETILTNTLYYYESEATAVFGAAITSAGTASVTGFELMVQSWILRVGEDVLTSTHSAFVAVLNGNSDWVHTKCDAGGANLLIAGVSTALPAFVKAADCAVLGAAFVS